MRQLHSNSKTEWLGGLEYDADTSSNISLYDLDGSTLVAVSLRIGRAIDPFSALDAFKNGWAFFWRGKKDDASLLMFGHVLTVSDYKDPKFLRIADERWVSALPFEADLKSHSLESCQAAPHEHSELGKGVIFLPELEIHLQSDSCTVRIRDLVPGSRDEVAARFDVDTFALRKLEPYLSVLSAKGQKQMALLSNTQDIPNFERWSEMIETVKHAIASSDVHKVVLSRHKLMELTAQQKIGSLLERLSRYNEESYLFAIVHPNGDGFIGRSPERLLAWDHLQVSVDAIAGTRKRHRNQVDADLKAAESLKSSAKDLIEHRFVSNYVKRLLDVYADCVEAVESEGIFQLRSVQHLRSSFSARLKKQMTPYDLLVALHPTPAVGGFPKASSIEMIIAEEPIKRGLFAGVIGVGNQHKGDFAIGIRTAYLTGNTLILHAGAGVVEDSDAESEWHEIEMKMENFLNLYTPKV